MGGRTKNTSILLTKKTGKVKGFASWNVYRWGCKQKRKNLGGGKGATRKKTMRARGHRHHGRKTERVCVGNCGKSSKKELLNISNKK